MRNGVQPGTAAPVPPRAAICPAPGPRVESPAQAVGSLLGFKLQQHAVGQRELLTVHPLDFLLQDGLKLLRRDRRGGMAAFHAGTIHPQNPSDKGRPNRRGRRINSNHEGILAAAAEFFDTNFTNYHEFKCAEGATEISPALTRSGYAGSASHKIILPLFLERGEGRGEESRIGSAGFLLGEILSYCKRTRIAWIDCVSLRRGTTIKLTRAFGVRRFNSAAGIFSKWKKTGFFSDGTFILSAQLK